MRSDREESRRAHGPARCGICLALLLRGSAPSSRDFGRHALGHDQPENPGGCPAKTSCRRGSCHMPPVRPGFSQSSDWAHAWANSNSPMPSPLCIKIAWGKPLLQLSPNLQLVLAILNIMI